MLVSRVAVVAVKAVAVGVRGVRVLEWATGLPPLLQQ
jgi:hypothetical protein